MGWGDGKEQRQGLDPFHGRGRLCGVQARGGSKRVEGETD
jgi:hypothetical protein